MATTRPPVMTPLRWLVVGTFVNRSGGGVRFLLVLYLTTERGLSPATAGAVAAAWGFGALAAQPGAGALADHLGRRSVIVCTMAGSAGAMTALGLARSTPLIVVLAVAAGVLNEGFRPAVQAMVADLAAPEERVRAFGAIYWATNAGFTVAMALGGWLAGVGWGWVFALEAATNAAFALVALLRLPETRPAAHPHDDAAAGGFATALRDPLLLAVAGLHLCFGLLLFQSASTLPLAMERDGLGPAAFGTVMAISGLAVVVGQPLAARPLARPARGLSLALGLLLAGLGFASAALAGSLAGFAVTAVVWTAGEIAIAAVVGAIVADIAPPRLRGRYMGVYATSFPLAAVVAPAAGTAIFEHAGETALWVTCGAIGAAAAVGAVLLTPAISRGSRRWA
jgi:MFS family permease